MSSKEEKLKEGVSTAPEELAEKSIQLTRDERLFLMDVVSQTTFRPGQSGAIMVAESILEKIKI